MVFNRPIWAPNVILVDFPNDQLEMVLPKIISHINLPNQVVGINAISDDLELESRKITIHQEDYEIYRELESETINPSTIMLNNKAKIVYYVDANTDSYKAAFSHIYDLIEDEYPILCLCNILPQYVHSALTICSDFNKYSASKLDKNIFCSVEQFLTMSIAYSDKQFQIT